MTGADRSAVEQQPLDVRNLRVEYRTNGGLLSTRKQTVVRAVDDVSLQVGAGSTLAIVGESGCGKTTLARAVMRLVTPVSGEILLLGHDIAQLNRTAMRKHRKHIQMIFQDPYASLDPRMTARETVVEGLNIMGDSSARENAEVAAELLNQVGISPSRLNDYPHQFSGGQRQRIGIARALAVNPEVIVCDEAVSALDVSVQVQVLNLLVKLQEQRRMSYMFISHDLAVVQEISTTVAVMYLGRIVELAPTAKLYATPAHPYSKGLLNSVPRVRGRRDGRHVPALQGELPSPLYPPSGCHFRTRCPLAMEVCKQERPELREIAPGHHAACHAI